MPVLRLCTPGLIMSMIITCDLFFFSKVMLFTKKRCIDSQAVMEILGKYALTDEVYGTVEIECRQDVTQIENYFQILCLTDSRAVSFFHFVKNLVSIIEGRMSLNIGPNCDG